MAVLRSVRTTEFATAERRFDSLRWPALAVWLGIPVIGFAAQPIAGRIVWTVAVAALPLFIVLIGYHRWRRICPLAWVNQIPARLGRAGTLRMPVWLEQHYYYISLGGFVLGLWLRLTWTNSDGVAIALFFTGLSVLALVAGALTTGISWCNYLCPVSFIEKVYTEPIGLRQTQNSQCTTCTACKKACPDINEENAYWKDIDLPSKRTAYFAYPGLICGFYLYYFLQSGTWDYYFGGSWTDQPGVIWHAFLPGQDAATAGFFFLPWIPRALGAVVPLLTCAAVSWLAFTVLVERNLVKPWQWGDPPPADPHDVILVHQTYSQSRERAHSDVLQIYRDSVRQAMAEHERIVLELAQEEAPGLLAGLSAPSPEKQLQLLGYLRALQPELERSLDSGRALGADAVKRLQTRYGVTPEEHHQVLDELRGRSPRASEAVEALFRRLRAIEAALPVLEQQESPTLDFLAELLRRQHDRARERILALLPDSAERLVLASGRSVPRSLEEELRANLSDREPYVRALAVTALRERGMMQSGMLRMIEDESELVREAAAAKASTTTTLDKMLALREVSVFRHLEPASLLSLARASQLGALFTRRGTVCGRRAGSRYPDTDFRRGRRLARESRRAAAAECAGRRCGRR
jgi:hypothetical protein